MSSTWLVTGAAGFVGAHVAAAAARRGVRVVGLDNLDPYYDVELKRQRLQWAVEAGVESVACDVADHGALAEVFERVRPTKVVHLAAQAGVRHAQVDHLPYATANLLGFTNVAELCRRHDVGHLVYASSSSVYGETAKAPFSVHDAAGHPVSLYAATKRANELIAHSYAHLHGLPSTGLRFFTAYGPWGRPDMAYWLFADAILDGRPVRIFGDGLALRDFTHVDDVVEAVLRVVDDVPSGNDAWTPEDPDPATSAAPWRLFNVGRGEQVTVTHLVEVLERELGRQAVVEHLEARRDDVPLTHADVSDLEQAVGFRPQVSFDDGMAGFCRWFQSYRSGA